MGAVVEAGKITEHEQIVAPQIVALDFDRTLVDSDACMKRFNDIALRFGIDIKAIKETQEKTEQDGGTFAPLTFLETLTLKKREEFYKDFISSNDPPIVYDDALPFLERLQKSKIPYHLLTYGADADWQLLKIKASGYQGEATIMGHPNKGEEISKWVQAKNTYVITDCNKRYIANSVCLVDDKRVAFSSLPEDCGGFLLQRNDRVLPSQKGKLPSRIETIRSLNELHVIGGRLKRVNEAVRRRNQRR